MPLAPSYCSYSLEVTPAIGKALPLSGSGGTSLTVSGANLAGVTSIRFMQGAVEAGSCSVSSATATAATCASAPALAPGSYSLVLRKANGENSVDPDQVGGGGWGRGRRTNACMPCHIWVDPDQVGGGGGGGGGQRNCRRSTYIQ